jgi:hypothetical protein
MSDTIRAVLFRAARAERAAVETIVDGYNANGLDSGCLEQTAGEAYRIFKKREMPDVTEPLTRKHTSENYYVHYGEVYLSDLAIRAIEALDALDVVIETTDRRDLLEQEFIKIRTLIEELAPAPVPVVVPAPDVVPVQEPLAFPDNGK